MKAITEEREGAAAQAPRHPRETANAPITWLRDFERRNKRPLRVLHIGNIANNAYLNAKILRRMGVEADVLSPDYYHIMACPEWEEVDLRGDVGDDNRPDWWTVEMTSFSRPRWFVQFPSSLSIRYLIAKAAGGRAGGFWRLGEFYRWATGARTSLARAALLLLRAAHLLLRTLLPPLRRTLRIARALRVQFVRQVVEERDPAGFLRWAASKAGLAKPPSSQDWTAVESAVAELEDPLRCAPKSKARIIKLLAHYDIVHVYGASGAYPLIAGHPFVAYEHGTLRSLPFEKTALGRLTFLTYTKADHVFITNCDTISSAKRLGLKSICFIPHPVNEDFLKEDESSVLLRAQLRDEMSSDFIIFHPSRQHWMPEDRNPSFEKGNDIFIKGFARFVREVNPQASGVFVEWGQSVAESKGLLASLGVADRVRWIRPVTHPAMARYILATEALADQFHLGSFGSTTPKAFACGRPVLLYLDEASHRWCLPEMPPVMNTRTDEDVFEALKRLYAEEGFRERVGAAARDWYWRHHSSEVIAGSLLRGYRTVWQRGMESASAGGDHR